MVVATNDGSNTIECPIEPKPDMVHMLQEIFDCPEPEIIPPVIPTIECTNTLDPHMEPVEDIEQSPCPEMILAPPQIPTLDDANILESQPEEAKID